MVGYRLQRDYKRFSVAYLNSLSDTDLGVEQEALIIPYLLWITLNIVPTLGAAFLGSYVEVCVLTYLCLYYRMRGSDVYSEIGV